MVPQKAIDKLGDEHALLKQHLAQGVPEALMYAKTLRSSGYTPFEPLRKYLLDTPVYDPQIEYERLVKEKSYTPSEKKQIAKQFAEQNKKTGEDKWYEATIEDSADTNTAVIGQHVYTVLPNFLVESSATKDAALAALVDQYERKVAKDTFNVPAIVFKQARDRKTLKAYRSYEDFTKMLQAARNKQMPSAASVDFRDPLLFNRYWSLADTPVETSPITFRDNELIFTDDRNKSNTYQEVLSNIPQSWQGQLLPSATRYESMSSHDAIRTGADLLPSDIEDRAKIAANAGHNHKLPPEPEPISASWLPGQLALFPPADRDDIDAAAYRQRVADAKRDADIIRGIVQNHIDSGEGNIYDINNKHELERFRNDLSNMVSWSGGVGQPLNGLWRGSSAIEDASEDVEATPKVQKKRHVLNPSDDRLYSFAVDDNVDLAINFFRSRVMHSGNSDTGLLTFIPWSAVNSATLGTDRGEVALEASEYARIQNEGQQIPIAYMSNGKVYVPDQKDNRPWDVQKEHQQWRDENDYAMHEAFGGMPDIRDGDGDLETRQEIIELHKARNAFMAALENRPFVESWNKGVQLSLTGDEDEKNYVDTADIADSFAFPTNLMRKYRVGQYRYAPRPVSSVVSDAS